MAEEIGWREHMGTRDFLLNFPVNLDLQSIDFFLNLNHISQKMKQSFMTAENFRDGFLRMSSKGMTSRVTVQQTQF